MDLTRESLQVIFFLRYQDIFPNPAKPEPKFHHIKKMSSRPEGEILCIRNIFEAEDFSRSEK
uniref:Uncharacterized protein n=1 Tax=Candidatus Kentrum sp. LPFa TaxID=2126335 RepID=A0A450WAV6_9GAMM|nr:MAG: hypothetical protein BECKLPF1236B_GA0070989_10586 [Candidatus Kentron sp. LPFa]